MEERKPDLNCRESQVADWGNEHFERMWGRKSCFVHTSASSIECLDLTLCKEQK